MKPGENPQVAAIRELEEETGYRAGEIADRGGFWMTPGYTTEFMHVFEATDLVRTAINPDEDEVIEIDVVPVAETLRMIDDGRVQDANSVASLLKVLLRR